MGLEQTLKDNILFNERISNVTNGELVKNNYSFSYKDRNVQDGGNYTISGSNFSYKVFDGSNIKTDELVISLESIQVGTTMGRIFSSYVGTNSIFLRTTVVPDRYQFYMTDGTNICSEVLATAPATNVISSIIVTLSSSNSTVNVYIDGVLVLNKAFSWTPFYLSQTTYIGAMDTSSSPWSGLIHDFSILKLDYIISEGYGETSIVDSLCNNTFGTSYYKFVYEYSTSTCQKYTLDTNSICERALKKLGVYTFGNSPRIEDMESAKTELNIMIKNWRADNVFIWKSEWINVPLKQSNFVSKSDGCYECIRSHKSSVSNSPITGYNSLGYWLKRYDVWETAIEYGVGSIVLGSDSRLYSCLVAHTSSATDTPITGVNYATYWGLYNTISPTEWVNGYNYHSICDIVLDDSILGGCKRAIGLGNSFLRNSQSQDSYINQSLQSFEYFRMGNKFSTGKPTMIYFKRNILEDELFIYPYPDTTEYTINIEVYYYPDNFSEATDNADFVDEWIKPIIDGLAYNLYAYYPGKNRVSKQELQADFLESYSKAKNSDSEKGDVQFTPDFQFSNGRY